MTKENLKKAFSHYRSMKRFETMMLTATDFHEKQAFKLAFEEYSLQFNRFPPVRLVRGYDYLSDVIDGLEWKHTLDAYAPDCWLWRWARFIQGNWETKRDWAVAYTQRFRDFRAVRHEPNS